MNDAVNDNITFGHALEALSEGNKVARAGWNGKGMWLIRVPGSVGVELNPNSPYYKAGLRNVDIEPHIDMFNAAGKMQPGWNPSQADLEAEDWVIVE